MQAISLTLLKSIAIFEALDTENLKKLASQLKLKQITKGEKIISRNDLDSTVYFVANGHVRVTSYTSDGKEAFFNDKSSGDFFGELSAIDGQPRTADVVSLSDAMLLFTDHRNFSVMLRDFPEVAERVQKHLVTEIRKLTERVYNYTALNVRYRIIAELCYLGSQVAKGDESVEIPGRLKHADIASRVATTREAVTREMSRLTKMGLIGKNQDHIVIHSLDKLQLLLPEY